MTMLIAGHETTAAVLTWAVFLLAQVQTTPLYIQFYLHLLIQNAFFFLYILILI